MCDACDNRTLCACYVPPIVANGYEVFCQMQVGFDVYDRLKRSGLELTLHSFHTALRGSSYLKAAGVQEVYAHLRSQPKVTPRERTFAYVFRAVASCGGGLPASWIIEVLHVAYSPCVRMIGNPPLHPRTEYL